MSLGIDGTDEGLAASWFDYDRDGWPDLYVANDFMVPIGCTEIWKEKDLRR